MRLCDGQVTGSAANSKGASYTPLNELSREPMYSFLRPLQAEISEETMFLDGDGGMMGG